MQLLAENINLIREKNGAVFSLHIPGLDIQHGDIVAVVGQSGCGKSTLLDILALILEPQSGKITLSTQGDTTVLTNAKPSLLAKIRKQHLGYVLQSGGLLPFLNVKENILLPANLIGISGKKLKQRFDNLMDILDIGNQIHKKPQHLSGGQRQRVAIARALIHSPSLVLADEPTAAVDSDTAENICTMFKQIVSGSNTAAIIVSHDRELMKKHVNTWAEFEVKTLENGEVHSTLLPHFEFHHTKRD